MIEMDNKKWLEENVEINWLTESEIDEIINNSNVITIDMSEEEWLSWSNETLKNN